MLNAGTVIRRGLDGKWSFASPEWDSLIKPLIASLEASGAERAPFQPHVAVDQWTKPKPGWLYLLDGSRLSLFDPATSKIMGSIRAGDQTDMALSPDGSRLYVVSGERESGELAVIETSNGAAHHIQFPDRALYRPWYAGLPPYSMNISSDGTLLRFAQQVVVSPEIVETRLISFDTRSEQFIHEVGDSSATMPAGHRTLVTVGKQPAFVLVSP